MHAGPRLHAQGCRRDSRTAGEYPHRLPSGSFGTSADAVRDIQSRLYAAIDAFRKETSIPLLCNTSLNDKIEPIVNKARA
jgi:hypothetical protein